MLPRFVSGPTSEMMHASYARLLLLVQEISTNFTSKVVEIHTVLPLGLECFANSVQHFNDKVHCSVAFSALVVKG